MRHRKSTSGMMMVLNITGGNGILVKKRNKDKAVIGTLLQASMQRNRFKPARIKQENNTESL